MEKFRRLLKGKIGKKAAEYFDISEDDFNEGMEILDDLVDENQFGGEQYVIDNEKSDKELLRILRDILKTHKQELDQETWLAMNEDNLDDLLTILFDRPYDGQQYTEKLIARVEIVGRGLKDPLLTFEKRKTQVLRLHKTIKRLISWQQSSE
jgi:hypothetical protein